VPKAIEAPGDGGEVNSKEKSSDAALLFNRNFREWSRPFR